MQKIKNKFILIISIVLCLISMIGASIIQTSFGKVSVKELTWETSSGHSMSALLFKPNTATNENKAPAIVVSHGWYNNKEMQDLNYVELSRRGFVVLSIDMYGHGDSDAVKASEWRKNGTGLYDGVKLLANLPYVDSSNIGVTGHSNGARASNWAVLDDEASGNHLIKSVLLVSNDGMYTSNENEPLFWSMQPPTENRSYVNRYGDRSVGIVADQYDEFFFRHLNEDGTVVPPRDYIGTSAAQSFLNFGNNPDAILRNSGTFYSKNIGGEESIRVIYTPSIPHAWSAFSPTVVKDTINFFDKTLGSPNFIKSSNQIWIIKVFFNAIGLIGFMMFIISFTKELIKIPYFNVLKSNDNVVIRKPLKGKSKNWFWISLFVIAFISFWSYFHIQGWQEQLGIKQPTWLPQPSTWFIGSWSAFMGLIIIVSLILFYYLIGKYEGMDLKERGILLSKDQWVKTVILSIIVVFTSFMIVFISDYFFKTDFRLWLLYIKAFDSNKIWIALKYLPLFLLFYVPNSIAINLFNYNGKKEWANTAILALFNGLSVILVVIINYLIFFTTGEQSMLGGVSILGIWAIPVSFILPLAAIGSRKIYRVTKNPYLPSIIISLIIALMSSSNSLTIL
ncbi:MAG: prolyl oligopeptidase family serine peptidase [Sphaerochaetaceae bacterium]|nr:prolyl oligopeptidase family serine peptidase [Sphaerochaetaceae bacterium]